MLPVLEDEPMKKSRFYIKDGKLQADLTTQVRLLFGVLIVIVGTIIFYYILTYIQTNRYIFENRPTGSAVVAVLDVFPPLFWTGIFLIVGIIEIARLIMLLIREKKEEKVQ